MWSSVLGLVSNFTPFSQARLWSMLWMRTYLSSNMSFYFQFTFLGNPITYCFGKTQYLLVIIIDIYFIKLIKLLSCWSLSVFEKKYILNNFLYLILLCILSESKDPHASTFKNKEGRRLFQAATSSLLSL